MRHHYAKFEADYVDGTIDWSQRGAVTAVQDGGSCGSCWAHAAVGAMEGSHFIKTGELLQLATQQLIDCDSFNFGCDGGFMTSAFEYAQTERIMLEADYPYVGMTDGQCHQDPDLAKVHTTRYINVLPNNPEQLKIAVTMGPVVAAVATSDPVFLFYQSGVISSENCGVMVDCAVTIVGFGEDAQKQQFWIVKNSWGESWGEHGYGKIAISEGMGVCGINSQATIPFTD